MIRTILFASLCFAALIWTTSASSCRPCDSFDCGPFNPNDCKYGITSRDCGCCQDCKNGPGDRCGGFWASLGGCGDGLRCQRLADDFNDQWPTGECVESAALVGTDIYGEARK